MKYLLVFATTTVMLMSNVLLRADETTAVKKVAFKWIEEESTSY